MKEEILKIVKMFEEGKLSKDEAVELIEVIKESENEGKNVQPSSKKRFLKIRVTKQGKPTVNITLPFSLVKWGISLAQRFSKNRLTVDGKELPLDLNELTEVLKDPDFTGKIIDVTDDDNHVEIEVT